MLKKYCKSNSQRQVKIKFVSFFFISKEKQNKTIILLNGLLHIPSSDKQEVSY